MVETLPTIRMKVKIREAVRGQWISEIVETLISCVWQLLNLLRAVESVKLEFDIARQQLTLGPKLERFLYSVNLVSTCKISF